MMNRRNPRGFRANEMQESANKPTGGYSKPRERGLESLSCDDIYAVFRCGSNAVPWL